MKKDPTEAKVFALVNQHGRRDVSFKPALEEEFHKM